MAYIPVSAPCNRSIATFAAILSESEEAPDTATSDMPDAADEVYESLRQFKTRPAQNIAIDSLFIAVGGGLGALCRHTMEVAFNQGVAGFAWGTFGANMIGSFILGVFLAAVAPRLKWKFWSPLIAIGFCGGFTTFSTFGVEFWLYITARHVALGVAYMVASMAVGFFSIWLGHKLGKLAGPAPQRDTEEMPR